MKIKYLGLQVGRGVAALLVLLHHATLGSVSFYGGEAFSGFFKLGSVGVDFFFVLSGFIIYHIHNEDEESLNFLFRFVKKRILRIYPPFIVLSMVMFLFLVIFHNETNRRADLTASLFLVPIDGSYPALPVSWTLMHEMLFYSIFCFFYIKKYVFYLAVSFWFLFIILFFDKYENYYCAFLLNQNNVKFIFGVLSAAILKHKKEIYIYVSFVFLTVLILLNWKNNLFLFNSKYYHIYIGIFFMIIILVICNIEKFINYPNVFIFIGDASYSIYLSHDPAISILNRIARIAVNSGCSLHPNIYFLFISLVSLQVGILYYFFVEKYLMKFFSKKW